MKLIKIARQIPPRTSAFWPLESPFEGPARQMYPTMTLEVRILAYVETTAPALFAITSEDPALYVAGKVPPIKAWPVSDLLFDAVTLPIKVQGMLYFVVSNTAMNFTIEAKGKIRVEPATESRIPSLLK